MNQNPAAFDVAQEFEPQPDPFMRTLQQSRNVDHHDRMMVNFCHPQGGLDRGERIVCHLWPCRADPAQQGRFARVGHADDPNVGDQLELQFQPERFPLFAVFSQPRRTVVGSLEGCVPPPAAPPPHDHVGLPRMHKIGQKLPTLRMAGHCPGGDRNAQVSAVRTGAVGTPTVGTCLRPMVNPMLQMVEGVEGRVDIQNDVAPPPPVAAIGAASRDKFFFAKGNDTVAAIPRFYIDTRTIVKHCLVPPIYTLLLYHIEARSGGRSTHATCRSRRDVV